MDWSQLLDASANQEQQGGIDQQLADILARRKAYQPSQHTTGLGSAFGGLADVLMRNKFDSQEAGLRQQRLDLAKQQAGMRGSYLQELIRTQQPVQAPPGMTPGQQFATPALSDPVTGLAPMMDRPQMEAQQQQKLQALQTGGMLSGDPLITQYLERAPKMAMEQEGLRKAQEERAALNAPETGSAYAAFAKQLGYPMQQGTPNATARGLLPLLEKIQAAREANQARIEAARLSAGARITASGMGGGGPNVDEAAVDQGAERYSTTGELPTVGGPAGALLKRRIINRAAELHPNANLAGNKASYHADTSSLTKAQGQADAIESFENTALKNLDNFLGTAHGVIETGSPLLNSPLRMLDKKVLGDANTAKFNTARQVAVQEIGKVLGGAVQGGVVSDSQRHEVESLLSGDMSISQIEAVANVLKQDMANRKAAVNAQLGAIRGRMGGKAPATEVQGSGPQKATHRFNQATGKIEAIP